MLAVRGRADGPFGVRMRLAATGRDLRPLAAVFGGRVDASPRRERWRDGAADDGCVGPGNANVLKLAVVRALGFELDERRRARGRPPLVTDAVRIAFMRPLGPIRTTAIGEVTGETRCGDPLTSGRIGPALGGRTEPRREDGRVSSRPVFGVAGTAIPIDGRDLRITQELTPAN